MTSARSLFRLHLLLGVLALGTVGLAGVVVERAVNVTAPSVHELVSMCQQTLVPVMQVDQLATLALLVLAALSALVAFRGLRSTARQLLATRRFMRTLRTIGPIGGEPFAVLIDDRRPLAFCAGYLRRRVYVSSGTVALLTASQLEAVLAHEAHHARRCDPLRMLVAQTLAESAFFIPVLSRSRERYAALAELAADDAAVSAVGRPGPLAAALLAFDAHGGPAVGVAEERVDHLTGQRGTWQVPMRDVIQGLLTVGALGVVALGTALASAGQDLDIATLAMSSCTILVLAAPVFAGLAMVQYVQRPRTT